MPDQGQGTSGADSSLLKGTDSKGAETSATGGLIVKGTNPVAGRVQGQGAGPVQPRGRGRRSALSKDGQKEMALRHGSGNPVRDVRLKQGRDNTSKNPSKEKPAKGKTVADPSETNTGSKGKPVLDSGVKPAESKADSMDKEVEDEVAKAFLTEQKK